MQHSKLIADTILRITPKLNKDKLMSAFAEMGPSCFFDGEWTEEQERGALKVFEWVEQHLDFKG